MEFKVKRNNELYHHGILGQKWGKRNGPPYPLDASDHSASEKKAGWKKSLNNKAVDEVKRQLNDKTLQPSENKKRGLTDSQKKALAIGAAAVATALIAYGGYRLIKAKKMDIGTIGSAVSFFDPTTGKPAKALTDAAIKMTKDFSVPGSLDGVTNLDLKLTLTDMEDTAFSMLGDRGLAKKMTDFSKWKDGENTIDKCVDIINSEVSRIVKGRDLSSMGFEDQINLLSEIPMDRLQNCMLCSTSYELNRRGIKCKANSSMMGFGIHSLRKIFNFPDKDSIVRIASNNVDDIKKVFEKYGNGARGNMIINWTENGSSHSVAWEIVNKSLNIFDCQTGAKYDSYQLLQDLFKKVKPIVYSARTDNATLKIGEDLFKFVIPA